MSIGSRLYRGEVSFDFVGKRRIWYSISAAILLLALGALLIRGLNLGIEFKGGAEFQVPTTTMSVQQARDTTVAAGVNDPIVTQLGNGNIRVQTRPLSANETIDVNSALAKVANVNPNDIKLQLVGPSWGADITSKALQGLIVFLILVVIFLTIYFDWRMAAAALVALIHDVVITVGIYALTGFEVTPATVIGVLTILGFSLYDTVVVFDKVRENTKGIAGQSRLTYSGAANLALNQTLVRSINTSIVALLPVLAILVVGAGFLGAGTLKDLALALFVGMLAGTYSSIFIATPVLCQLQERQPEMKAVAARVEAREKAKASAKADGTDLAPSDAGDELAAVSTADDVVIKGGGGRNQPQRKPKSKRG